VPDSRVQDYLRISEINYNPRAADPDAGELDVDNDQFEFVELVNTSSDPAADPLVLTDVRFADGITFDFAGSAVTELGSGEFVLVVRNQAAFESRYGTGWPVAGVYTGGLDNGGERIWLVDAAGSTVLDFSYGDDDPWPGRADGRGASLEPVDPAGDYNDQANWRSSSEFNGSPGEAGTGPIVDVVINEVLTHTDLPAVDTIELYNTTTEDIDITGWYLSDSWGWASNPNNGDYKKFRIPDNDPQGRNIIPAGGYVRFDESDFNSSGGAVATDFSLNGAHGDDVWLMEADNNGQLTRFADHVEFGAAANGETIGRWPNGYGVMYPMITNTPGDANSGPRVGLLIVNEIMYHPTPPTAVALAIYPALTEDDLEYVEIYNPTGDDVPLVNWRICQGIDFDFPDSAVLLAGGALAILSFDPNAQDAQGQLINAERTAAFLSHYDMDTSVTLIGAYTGRLDNGGERVQLQRPDDPPLEEPAFTPHLLEDEALYDDVSPWPTEPDGGGLSLTRNPADAWGHAHTSWEATTPTPGDVSLRVFTVDTLSPSTRGFVATFDRPLDPRALNLYDTESGTLGPADVALVGDAVGPVSGSLVFDEQSVTFFARGGLLPADTYTVTLRSGEDAFNGMTVGELLDGDGDGIGGDDYVNTFVAAPSEPVQVSLPDFMRGPAQPVAVPATQTGLPLHINEANGVSKIDVVLIYDPTLLNVSGVVVGPGMPADATASLNWFRDRGDVRWVSLTFRTSDAELPPPLPPGPADVMSVIADVPASAPLGAAQVLEFLVASINDLPLADPIAATALESIQVVGFLGDTTGNQSYSGLDAQRAARVAVGLDSGFAAYPNIDPVIVADVTGNGNLSGLDAQRIALEAVGLGADEIPDLPQALRLAVSENRVRSAHPSTVNSSGAPSAPYELVDTALAPVVEDAVARIESAVPDVAAILEGVQFEIVDLPENLLGLTVGDTIRIDVDAAGYGWFVEKYQGQGTKDKVGSADRDAIPTIPHSAFRIPHSVDLLTVVLHELGHVLGLGHQDEGIMDDTLPLGTRRLPDDAFGDLSRHDRLDADLVDDAFASRTSPP
jgi:hypothetical protein